MNLVATGAICALALFGSEALADDHGNKVSRVHSDAEARERVQMMERERRHREEQGHREEDPLAEYLFPPEMIMRHREALGISKAQGKSIVALMSGFQSGVVETQWKLGEAKSAVKSQLEAERINEAALRKALDELFALENAVKRGHILLLAQLRNELNSEQIEKLRRLN